ncbi:TPA: hypothetical protein IXG64_002288 [Enterococcus faecium]|nr:hypothetical protein [Enterococcus faecium]
MASSLYNLALDFSKELNYTKAIMARQGDKGITVTVKPFLNGLQMDTSGGTFTLKGTTPSNRYVDNVATSVTSEEVTFSLDGTFMSEAGYYKHCYVEYRKGNQILTTQDIIFFSLGVSDISQGQADEYVSQLEELIRKYNETFDAFMAEIKGRVDSLNQQITDLTGQAKTLQDKLDALKEGISKLGNLQVMYSNSIDFGDYDYSGRPNLFLNLDFSKLSRNASAITEPPAYVKDGGSHFVLDFSDPSANGVDRSVYIPAVGRLEKGATYIATVPIMISDDFSTDYGASPIYPYCVLTNNVATRVTSLSPDNSCRGKWGLIKKTFTVPANMSDGEFTYFQVISTKTQVGKLYIGYDIKIEKVTSTSDTATPYQPNLLDAPYYLSKVALGENIADPTVKFPITSSSDEIYSKKAPEDFVLGETYTVTIGATKPASQTIRVYLAQKQFSDFKPVEGLVDTWVATVSITQLGENAKGVYLFQTPNTSLGSCTIKWLKIEKGNTRTPNISQFKYFGEGLKDSNNPNDYSWDVTPEYTEKGLNDSVSLTEPETVLGLKNFKDGAQIDGVDVATVKNLGSVLQSGSGLTTIQSDKQSAFDEFSYEFERIGDRVFFHARVKTNSTTAVASHVNLLEIPLGFQFPIGWTIIGIPLSVVQWTTPQGEISALAITDLTGKQVVKFATNRVGNHYISGEWRTADSYPETK